jgi:hypothetical protein
MLSTVGAMKLSEAALELEIASQDGNAEYCQENYPGFLEELTALHTRLSAVFEK